MLWKQGIVENDGCLSSHHTTEQDIDALHLVSGFRIPRMIHRRRFDKA
jgi:hypothetical protein